MVEQGEEKVENEWFYNEENPSSTSLCLLLLTTGKKEKILCICCCSLFLLFYLLPLVPSTFSCLLGGVDHETEFLEVQPGRISIGVGLAVAKNAVHAHADENLDAVYPPVHYRVTGVRM